MTRDVRPFGVDDNARDSELATRDRAAGAKNVDPKNVDPAHPARVPAGRRDTHVTDAESPVGIGIDAQMPNSMPRAEDDVITRSGSRDFHDQPGSGGNIARRHLFF